MNRKNEPPRLSIRFWPFAMDATGIHAIFLAFFIVLVVVAVAAIR